MISYISLEITWRHGGRSMGAPEAPRKKQQEKKKQAVHFVTLPFFATFAFIHRSLGVAGLHSTQTRAHTHTTLSTAIW